MGMFSNDLSIDLGTANTLIYVREQGVVLDVGDRGGIPLVVGRAGGLHLIGQRDPTGPCVSVRHAAQAIADA